MANRNQLFIAGFAMLGGILLPSFAYHDEHRFFVQPLEVSIDRGSPAFSAFEDSKLFITQTNLDKKNNNELRADFESKNKIEIAQEVKFEGPRKLKGLTIKLVEKLAAYKNPKEVIAEKYWAEAGEVENLKSKADQLISAALFEDQMQTSTGEPLRVISANSGTQIIVSRAPSKKIPAFEAPKAPREYVQNTPRRSIHAESPPAERNNFEHVLAGNIQLAGGAAVLPGVDEVRVFHSRDLHAIAEGSVSIQSGSYKINVDKPEGFIIAEVRNREGALIARGEKSLLSVDPNVFRSARIDNLDLKILPTTNDLQIQIVDAESSPKKRLSLSSANLDILGLERRVAFNSRQEAFVDKEIVSPSQLILRASEKSHWPAIKSFHIGEEGLFPLYKTKTIKSLFEYAFSDRREAEHMAEAGVIWGIVKKNGVPLSGAVVSVMDGQNTQTNYFSGPLIDKNLIMTSASGEFVVFGVPRGGAFIQVQQLGEELNPSMVFVEPGHLTEVDINIESRPLGVRAFDAETLSLLPARVGFWGSDIDYNISKDDQNLFRWNLSQDNSLLQIDAGEEYVLAHTNASSRMSELVAPIVKEKWYQKALQRATRITEARKKFSAYGIVSGENFVVSVPGMDQRAQIMYFNPDGSPRAEDFGIEDGFFVIAGLNQGLQTIAIIPERTKKVITQPIWIIEGQPHASYINLQL